MRKLLLGVVALVASCSSKTEDPPATPAVQVVFELDADFDGEGGFFRFPFPADLRLSTAGTPRGQSFPNPLGKSLVTGLRGIASDRAGWPLMPVAYFRFDGAITARSIDTVVTTGPFLLIDVDDASPDRGKTFPVVASTLTEDDYVPTNVLGLAARPGFVLHGKRTYAFVVLKSANDAKGAPLGQPAALGALLAGQAPAGARGAAAAPAFGKLGKVLGEKGVVLSDVAAATVFTTGDVVADLGALTDKMVEKYSITVTDTKVDPDDGAKHDRYCEVQAKVTYPQFQKGAQPFDKEGLFVLGPDGLPQKQGDLVAPITLTLPKAAMPKGGYPLVIYFHGSGGRSDAIADRGKWRVTDDVASCPQGTRDEWLGKLGCNTKGEGPGHVVAPFGIAMAASALPVNPERLPGAKETEYLNFANLAAFRDTFRQGVIEQRLLIRALEKLTIDPTVVAACTGMSLPADETAYRFSTAQLMAQGQSMGGMYTNIISAVDPKIQGLVPTGAGGYWSFMITKTKLYDDTAGLIAALLGANREGFSFMHPALHLLQTAWEPSDPFVYMPRVSRRPLPGHPVRAIYEPVGKDDSYFPTVLYDAVALSYGHPEAGESIWPTMQDALTLGGLGGLRPYPISNNLKSEDGRPYTGILVQYAGDGVYDPHAIYSQLDAVKYQYGCFYSSVLKKAPTVVAPAALGTPCP